MGKQKLENMYRRLLELLKLVKPRQTHLPQTNVSGSASRKPNPYQLVYWRSDWTESKTRRNNTKYWEFEIEHNGLRLP
jgi:predicted lipoprotein